MSEILFYHLTHSTLEQTLPGLVERSLSRGWNVVLQASTDERLEGLDDLLWTWKDESFIGHSSQRDGNEALQPVWLTVGDDNPNSAAIRFLVESAQLSDTSPYERVVYMFDGLDNEAVEQARNCWKQHKGNGDSVSYWQQSQNGGWEQKA